MSKTKPKSVDEIRLLECIHQDGELYLVNLVTSIKQAKHDIKRFIARSEGYKLTPSKYRIRKWRAETVCEYRLNGKIGGGFYSRCKQIMLYGGWKYCPHCGGKIRVRK